MVLYQKIYPNFIVQEFLQNDGGEFTCGLFRSTSGEIRDIILKRKFLLSGHYIKDCTLQLFKDLLGYKGYVKLKALFKN